MKGPPPDPGYNFLADRSRDTDAAKREAIRQKEVLRQRHPRNFGGGDFNNVKTQIKMDKQKVKIVHFFVYIVAFLVEDFFERGIKWSVLLWLMAVQFCFVNNVLL